MNEFGDREYLLPLESGATRAAPADWYLGPHRDRRRRPAGLGWADAMANLGIGGLDHLSRWSDHLGALAVALRDLGGPTTLLHELVQNADDSKTCHACPV